MITSKSRYATNETILMATTAGPAVYGISRKAPVPWDFSFTYYEVQEGDSIDYLAFEFYADSTMWWLIANANPQILFWEQLTPGTTLRIPSG